MKQRIVIYLTPDAVRAMDILRSWSGARSRGSLVEVLLEWAAQEWGQEVVNWAVRRWRPHDQERREDENHD